MSVLPTDNQYSINVTNDTLNRAADAVKDAPPVEPVIGTTAASAVPAIGIADEGNTSPEDLAEVTMESRDRVRAARKERARRILAQRQRTEIPGAPAPAPNANETTSADSAAFSSKVSAATTIAEVTPASQMGASPAALPGAGSNTVQVTSVPEPRRRLADPNNAHAFLNTTSSPAVQELLSKFKNYDNSRAVQRFDNYLAMFALYASTGEAVREQYAEANLRAAENVYYQYLGISHYEAVTRDVREGFANAIERWYVGEGVFSPEMFGYSSADGFHFSSYSPESQNALLYHTVLSSYDRQQIVQYLREMARLTPNDFLFYDPTGLETLRLEERQEFFRAVDQMLTDAGIDVRAADLQYAFNQDGTLDLEYLDEQLLEQQRLEDYILQRTDKYGQMLNMFQKYGLATISASFF